MATTHVHAHPDHTGALAVVTVLVILLVLAAAGYLVWATVSQALAPTTTNTVIVPAPSAGTENTGASAGNNGTQAGWQTFSDPTTGVSFQYPASLGTTYLNAATWPPTARVLNEAFSCSASGSVTAPGGETMPQTINGHQYCVTRVTQGAAGNLFTSYSYAFPKANETAVLSFGLSTAQCGVFVEPQRSDCLNEQAAFDVGALADQMAQTLTLNK
jgi:hypothetical protein